MTRQLMQASTEEGLLYRLQDRLIRSLGETVSRFGEDSARFVRVNARSILFRRCGTRLARVEVVDRPTALSPLGAETFQ
jgi:hypothetical protein